MGNFVRDKDAIIAAMLIAEATQYHKNFNKTLIDVLDDIQNVYGFYSTDLTTITFNGLEGQNKISIIMDTFRDFNLVTNTFKNISYTEDYLNSKTFYINGGFKDIVLPKSDVIKYVFNDTSWFALRPSGTEPNLKIYYSIVKGSKIESSLFLTNVKILIKNFIAKIIEN
jgi:phosphoglucomutase